MEHSDFMERHIGLVLWNYEHHYDAMVEAVYDSRSREDVARWIENWYDQNTIDLIGQGSDGLLIRELLGGVPYSVFDNLADTICDDLEVGWCDCGSIYSVTDTEDHCADCGECWDCHDCEQRSPAVREMALDQARIGRFASS